MSPVGVGYSRTHSGVESLNVTNKHSCKTGAYDSIVSATVPLKGARYKRTIKGKCDGVLHLVLDDALTLIAILPLSQGTCHHPDLASMSPHGQGGQQPLSFLLCAVLRKRIIHALMTTFFCRSHTGPVAAPQQG